MGGLSWGPLLKELTNGIYPGFTWGRLKPPEDHKDLRDHADLAGILQMQRSLRPRRDLADLMNHPRLSSRMAVRSRVFTPSTMACSGRRSGLRVRLRIRSTGAGRRGSERSRRGLRSVHISSMLGARSGARLQRRTPLTDCVSAITSSTSWRLRSWMICVASRRPCSYKKQYTGYLRIWGLYKGYRQLKREQSAVVPTRGSQTRQQP